MKGGQTAAKHTGTCTSLGNYESKSPSADPACTACQECSSGPASDVKTGSEWAAPCHVCVIADPQDVVHVFLLLYPPGTLALGLLQDQIKFGKEPHEEDSFSMN